MLKSLKSYSLTELFRIVALLLLLFHLTTVSASARDNTPLSLYRAKNYPEALKRFASHPLDDPVSAFFMADIYCNGLSTPKDEKKCIELLKVSATGGYASANYLLGRFYYYGTIVHRDKNRAFSHLAASSKDDYRGYLLLQIIGKKSAGEQNDMKLLQKQLLKSAKGGNPAAGYSMAFAYLTGDGVPRNSVEEIKWYKASADASARSALTLALAYFYGDSVEKSLTESFSYMQKGAVLGDPRSAYYLGTFYYHGTGTAMDREAAAYWFRKGAEGDDPDASLAFAMMLLAGDSVKKDRARAVELLGYSSSQGNLTARDILRDLLTFRGEINTAPGIVSDRTTQEDSVTNGKNDGKVTLEGRGVMIDRGGFGLKFSLPSLYDAYSPRGQQPNGVKQLWEKLQGGTVDLIYRP